MLSRDTTIKLTGTYMEQTYKGIDIEASKIVNLNLKIDESAQAELSTEIITNKLFSINGENKRIVQLLVKSRLTENQYPIKETSINIGIPTLGENTAEDVKVLSLGTLATNGNTETTIDNWENKDGNVKIVLPNKVNSNNEISWKKDVYDEIIVTFIYPEETDAQKIEIKTASEIQIYNGDNKYTAEHTVGIENKELNNIITSTSEVVTNDLYKGQLYANTTSSEKKEIPFSTETTLDIRYIDISDKIIIQENKDKFVSESTSVDANTRYISTEINKDNMLNILGQDGTIQIKSGDIIYNLTKDTETNENGNIVINYDTTINELEITTSKPINEGKLVIYHNKAMMPNLYTIEEIRKFTDIELRNTIVASLGEENILENTTETQSVLNETISKAELTVDKESLSTLTTNEQVNIGVKLITDGVQYDLYKNPTLKIQLPSSVESINVNSINKLYGDEFDIKAEYLPAEKAISIKLTGEQSSYPENSATQLYIQINLDITLSKFTPSKTDKILLTYTNEKGLIYDGLTTGSGTLEKAIGISSQNGLMVMNNSSTYNITGISGITENKQTVQILSADTGKEVSFDMALVNNTGSDISNVRIFGKLPTDGNKITDEENVNTFKTTLKNAITAPNATIYYSENANASTDITDSTNGWTTDLNTLTNPRLYLIQLESVLKENYYTFNYNIQLPNEIKRDEMSATEFKVIYDTVDEKDAEVNSTIIQFITPTAVNMETNLVAEVGNDKLNSGDKVKAGEVIKYTVTVKNTGAQTIENITLKSGIPNGTVFVEPEENYPYTGSSYYVERTDITEFSTTIESLASNETYTVTYEVRVKSDINDNDEISNKATVSCADTTIESNEIKNTLEQANVRVTVKRAVDLDINLVAGLNVEYFVFIENLTNESINDLEIKFNIENADIQAILITDNDMRENIPDKVTVGEIPANSKVNYKIIAKSQENASEVVATAVVNNSEGITYRSNKIIDKLEYVDGKISLSTPNNGEYISEGDTVEYNINVENTGNITSIMLVEDNISEYLEVFAVYENNEIKSQTTDPNGPNYCQEIINQVFYTKTLKPGEMAQIKILAKVKAITEDFDVKEISNKVTLKVNSVTKNSSGEVVHLLRGNNSEDVKNIISGIAWFDENLNAQKDDNEKLLQGITVRILDITTGNYLTDENGNVIETQTDENGKYRFTKIKEGTYIILFEYDMENYEPTVYKKEGVADNLNSKVILKKLTINGQEKEYAVTDTIKLDNNLYNVNIGLKERIIFDLELNKYISKITIQNGKGTKTYNYENSVFEKVEIPSKYLNGSLVVIEYTIKVKNTGEISGYTTSIVDYLPNEMTFSSELNQDWYLSGNNLYTKALANEKINPGEEKEVKLILTKNMTDNNTGLINNRAEISETYNEKGSADIDSVENNQAKGEDDIGAADVIISISTGATIIMYVILGIVNTVLIIIALKLILKNSSNKRFRKERG